MRDTLLVFLGNLIDGMYFHETSNAKIVENAVRMRDAVRARLHHRYDDIVMDLRDLFSKKEWTAVLIPSGFQESLSTDQLLTSKFFLSKLSRTIKAEPHLILQLNEAPQKDFAITDIYPPFHIRAVRNPPAGREYCSGAEATNRCFSRFRRKTPKTPSDGYSPEWMTSRIPRGSFWRIATWTPFLPAGSTRLPGLHWCT